LLEVIAGHEYLQKLLLEAGNTPTGKCWIDGMMMMMMMTNWFQEAGFSKLERTAADVAR
jgi:hypothetical protein